MMRKRTKILALAATVLLVTVALLAAGCGGGAKEQPGDKSGADAQKDWPKGVIWSGSALGGAHYMFGSALAQVVQKHMNVPMQVEASGGPWQSMDLINKGQADFGPAPGASAWEAYNGEGKAKGAKYDNLRAVMPMFPQYMQWWTTPDSGLKSFRDLEGKRVDMSGPGSFLNDYGRKLFDFFDVKPAQITNLANFEDANQRFIDGQLDAVGAWSGIPAPPAQEMCTTRGAKVFGVPKEDGEKFIKEYHVQLGVIPAGTYKGQTEDIETLADWTFVVTHKDISEDFIYNLVKTAFEKNPELVAAYKASVDSKAENAKYTTIPMHPGAVKYYREIGIELPEVAIPPEMK
ncbi:MAG: TAXI family TRAP transporter solute-binding subunit [Thermoanaerobacterales bacterium]|nr:TAXI family TRAP transporter solute-binding subunit [Thermoanaerobacterales bacterium]